MDNLLTTLVKARGAEIVKLERENSQLQRALEAGVAHSADLLRYLRAERGARHYYQKSAALFEARETKIAAIIESVSEFVSDDWTRSVNFEQALRDIQELLD